MTSSKLFNDVSTIHARGTSIATDPTIRIAYVMADGIRRRVESMPDVASRDMDPPPCQTKVQPGQQHDREEQQPRHRAGQAHMEIVERLEVEVEHVEQRRARGSAGHTVARHAEHVRRVECLESADESHDQVEEDDG